MSVNKRTLFNNFAARICAIQSRDIILRQIRWERIGLLGSQKIRHVVGVSLWNTCNIIAYCFQSLPPFRNIFHLRKTLSTYHVYLPVGKTMAIHIMIGSVQNSWTWMLACPKQYDSIASIPMNTVVSCCFIPFPKRPQIYEKYKSLSYIYSVPRVL